MKLRIVAVATALLISPLALHAQSAAPEQPGDARRIEQPQPTLREQLMPPATALTLRAPVATESAESRASLAPVAAPRSAGLPLMIAGGALFVAGLIAGGDGGTVLVIAGAGIGAYGLYLYFQ